MRICADWPHLKRTTAKAKCVVILRFAQNDNVKQTTARTTTKSRSLRDDKQKDKQRTNKGQTTARATAGPSTQQLAKGASCFAQDDTVW
jgi:hypothetical protein